MPEDFSHKDKVENINKIGRPEENPKNKILITLISLYAEKDFTQPWFAIILLPLNINHNNIKHIYLKLSILNEIF